MARWFLILLSGCSLTLSGPDPNRPRTASPTCDTGKSMVAVDGTLAATTGLVAIGMASNDDGAAAVVPAVLASLFLLSAIHGNSTVDACRRDMDNFASAMAAPPMPAQMPVQPAIALPPVQPAVMAVPPPPPPRDDPWSAFWREVP
jgi:hypothetical protein